MLKAKLIPWERTNGRQTFMALCSGKDGEEAEIELAPFPEPAGAPLISPVTKTISVTLKKWLIAPDGRNTWLVITPKDRREMVEVGRTRKHLHQLATPKALQP